jgi:hypothetical protein
MKKIHIIIAFTTLILWSCNKEETPIPAPVQPTTTTPTGGSGTGTGGNYGGASLQLYVVVEKVFGTGTLLCNVDSLFSSIKIGNVEMVDTLKLDNRNNFYVGGMGLTDITLYTLTFSPPIPYGDTHFQLDIEVDGNVSGRQYVHMVVMPLIISGSNIGDYRTPCTGLHTYDVDYIGNDDWTVTNPCQ